MYLYVCVCDCVCMHEHASFAYGMKQNKVSETLMTRRST